MTGKRTDRNSTYLNITAGESDFENAKDSRAHSGRCMIAQALMREYGPRTKPIVDSDYIRFTAPNGDRLFYRTPPEAAAALILFDAGTQPVLPLTIRARLVFQRRSRAGDQATPATVRKWAREQDIPVKPVAPIPAEVTAAFLNAHPGTRIQNDKRKAITTQDNSPKMDVGPQTQPVIGNLAGGHVSKAMKVPASRRRTWGSKQITKALIDQGWQLPAEPPGTAADPAGTPETAANPTETAACPVEAVFGPDDRYPCLLNRGHDGSHHYTRT
jgi:hypothetical protein